MTPFDALVALRLASSPTAFTTTADGWEGRGVATAADGSPVGCQRKPPPFPTAGADGTELRFACGDAYRTGAAPLPFMPEFAAPVPAEKAKRGTAVFP